MAMTFAWTAQRTRIHQVVTQWAATIPAAVAFEDEFASLTYEQLERAINDVAMQLRGAGVRAGDRVLLVAENAVATAVLALAVTALDAWTVVVNARLSPREIDDYIAHSGARLTFYTTRVSTCAADHAARHGAASVDFPSIGPVHGSPVNVAATTEPVSTCPTVQVAAMIYTSGTSGTPKAVMLTHANLLFAAEAVRDVRHVKQGDRIYGVMPMAHVVGLSTQMLGTLLCGATLILRPQFRPEDVAKSLLDDGITIMTGVPAMFARLLDWAKRENRIIHAPFLRYASAAGSPLSPSLKRDVEKALGVPLHSGYGLTEMVPTVSMTHPEAPRTDCAVGAPIPGVEVRFVDCSGQAVGVGEVGELWVRGPNVMKGYYKSPELTAQAVDQEGWFNTGDLARQGPDGALHIEGRTKEMIIRSGFNVYPVEVEQVINTYPGIVQSAAVSRAVPDNEEVVAFLEVSGNTSIDLGDLAAYLRERLSPYKIPGEIRIMGQLPAAPTGKILKHVLKDIAKHVPPSQKDGDRRSPMVGA